MDLMKSSAEASLDPNILLPALGAATVVGANQIGKRLPGAAAKAAPVVGAAAKKVADTASRALNTGLPFIDDTFNRGKAAFDYAVPRWMSENIEPKAAPIRAAVQNAVGKISASPVGKLARAYKTNIAEPIGKFNKAMTTGPGGKANRALSLAMMGSPTGNPYVQSGNVARTQIADSILRQYTQLSDPAYLTKMLSTPQGEKDAKAYLGRFQDQLNRSGMPEQAVKHIITAMRNPGVMQLSDHQSIKDILMRFIPEVSAPDDPTFRPQGAYDTNVSDLVNGLTFNAPDIASSIPALGLLASGGKVNLNNPLFEMGKNSNTRGEDAIGRFANYQRGGEIARINAALQRPKTKTSGPISMNEAQRQMMLFDALMAKKGY
jgi:hypothetical protein